MRFLKAAVVSALIAVSVSSCGAGEDPFLIVQVCLENDRGVDDFKKELHAIAAQERMGVTDRSREAERELESLGALNVPKGRFLSVSLNNERGFGLGANNLGLGSYDVAVGFNLGQDNDGAKAFAERAVARFKQRWPVPVVPSGSGALPNPRCPAEHEAPSNNSSKPTPLRGAA